MAEEGQTPKKRNLLSKLVGTPEGKMALVQAGLSLMAPRDPGASRVSQFGEAIGMGINNYNQSQADIRGQRQVQQEMDMNRQALESDLMLNQKRGNMLDQQANYQAARASAASSPTPQSAQSMTENPVYQSLLDNELANNPQSPNLLKVQLQFRTLQSGGRPGDIIAADNNQVLQLQRDPETGAPMVDPSGGVTFISHPDGNPIVLPMEQAAQISPDVAGLIQKDAQSEAATQGAMDAMLTGGLFTYDPNKAQ